MEKLEETYLFIIYQRLHLS